MGTNYYLYHKAQCMSCGRESEPDHIGKSSYGWCFALHVMPDEEVHDLDDWIRLWRQPGAYIKDEYGKVVSPDDMENIITRRSHGKDFDEPGSFAGYADEAEFHRENGSERGPNNLMRARLCRRVIKHGAGTWDCHIGDFS